MSEQENKNLIKEIEKELDSELFDGVARKGEWEGYAVYEPVLKEFSFVGPPVFYLVKNDKYRLTTYEEGMEIFNKIYPSTNEEEEELEDIYS